MYKRQTERSLRRCCSILFVLSEKGVAASGPEPCLVVGIHHLDLGGQKGGGHGNGAVQSQLCHLHGIGDPRLQHGHIFAGTDVHTHAGADVYKRQMYDYMKALHARFCQEPEVQKVRAELEQAYREIKARLGQQGQETLLQLTDLENELREETSLASFIAGFQLGMGIAGEMERYCFEDEEGKRATERAKMSSHVKD